MQLLLDTHIFLWFVNGDTKLNPRIVALIKDTSNEVFVSVVSLLEIAIKVSIGKYALSRPYEVFIPDELNKNLITVLDIEQSHLNAILTLPFHHRDPFDRLMIAQALTEQLTLVSVDKIFDSYGIVRIG